MEIVTGIGSRDLIFLGQNLKPELTTVITEVWELFNLPQYILRSGGANGMDVLFETIHDEFNGKKEIYLPWKKFNGSTSLHYNISTEAKLLAQYYHPLREKLDGAALKLMARNGYQVLGEDLNTPTSLIICWTPNETNGGTSQALRIAKDYNIPVFNLFELKDLPALKEFLS